MPQYWNWFSAWTLFIEQCKSSIKKITFWRWQCRASFCAGNPWLVEGLFLLCNTAPLPYNVTPCNTMACNVTQYHTMSHNTMQYQVGSGPFSPAPQASFCWEFLRAKAACDPMPLNDHLPLGSFPRRAIWKHIFDPQKPLFPSWHFKKRRLIFSFYIQNSKQG